MHGVPKNDAFQCPKNFGEQLYGHMGWETPANNFILKFGIYNIRHADIYSDHYDISHRLLL